MNRRIFSVAAFFILVSGMALSAASSTNPPAVGGVLPDFHLAVPQDAGHREYLGLDSGDRFQIPQIEARVVIIELFSMYCPHCQREASTINRIYEKIEKDPQLKGEVKIIGIGVGNSAYEVKHFRKTYDVPFPLFADGNFAIHKQLGEVRTPYFIGIRIHDDGRHTVFYSRLGGPRDAGEMLEDLINQSGLIQG